MYDYKNYPLKWEKQRSKISKDSLISSEITFWITKLRINFKEDNIIFVTSDFDLRKELIKFKEDIISWKINQNEYYNDLSPFFLSELNKIFSRIKILKLYPDNCLFENEYWKKSKLIEDII